MPERTYFSFRYAIPGYTFILLVIAINYVPLLKILETTQAESAFGAFLAFLSLFAGSAIGFLISQFWYWWFMGHPLLGTEELEPVSCIIYKKYLKTPKETKGEITSQTISDNIKAIGVAFEYIIRLKEQEKFLVLAERRWDMYHTLSSTLLALVMGAGVGMGFRIYYQIFLFNASFSILISAEAVALIFIFICMGVLVCVICKGRKRMLADYCPLLKLIIRKCKVDDKELRIILSEFKKLKE